MKLLSKAVTMSCTLTLNERETEMLAWLAGYGGKQIAENICKGLTEKFDKKEWDQLWSEIRGELENQQKRFIETRNVFIGNQKAIWPSHQKDEPAA